MAKKPPAPDYTPEERALLARSCIGGKKTAVIKVACSEELKELLLRKLQVIRAETGRTVSESEWGETVFAISLLGLEHVQIEQQKQFEKLAGYWPKVGQGVSES